MPGTLGRCFRGACAAIAILFCTLALPSHALEAGAAKVELTPPIGTPLNGYGDRLARGSVAKHDPLWARSLYLSDGETAVFLVNVDLCMINAALRARVLELAPAEVPREHIFLTATHTHNGPGGMEDNLFVRFVSGRFMPEVLEGTARSIAESMRGALQARRRAAIGYDTAKQTVLSVNRREPGGPIDEQIGVIRVDDADGVPIAIVGNFAAHPTSVPEESHYAWSSDYVGYYYDEVERLAGDGCVALFMNGAEGNQTITDPEGNSGWERTANVGRLLAVRVKGVANEIDCDEATLRVGYSEPMLPQTLATRIQPSQTVLQTLEINDLLLCFWPGEPIVELGLELRRQALARGYSAQFSVGLSNNYLMYFVDRPYFGNAAYESAMNFYGPGVSDWFYREFGRLMSRGTPEPEPSLPETVMASEVPAGLELTVGGDSFDRGYQRGAAFATDVRTRYEQRIPQQVYSGSILPESSAWSLLPSWVDPSPLALPTLAMAARARLGNVSIETLREMEGMAAAADLPFDALWLLQNAHGIETAADKGRYWDFPLCTVVAATGDRAGDAGVLIGRNLDWPHDETPVFIEHRPETGRGFLEIGFTWNAGIFSGMNDAGVVVCVESTDASLKQEGLHDAPVAVHLRAVLQEAGTLQEAIAQLQALDAVQGDAVLVAGPTREGFDARLVTASGVVAPEAGLLMRQPSGDGEIDAGARARYGQAATLLGEEGPVDVDKMEEIMTFAGGDEDSTAIWNAETRHAAVFVPSRREVRFSFRRSDGVPGPFVVRRLREAAAGE